MRALRPWSLHTVRLSVSLVASLALAGGFTPMARAQSETPSVGDATAEVSETESVAAEDASRPPTATVATQTLSPGGIDSLEQAWFTPAYGLPERAKQLRGAADRIGLESVDAAARAVLLGKLGADAREEAEVAVLLAPDLPSAHAALAKARWAERDTAGALRAALMALSRSFVHLEALLWTTATAGWLLFVALLAGGFGYVALRGLAALPLAAHDLGEGLESTMATPARLALVVSAILVPAAFGEGPLGSLAVLFLLALLYSRSAERRALVVAALFAFVALDPLAQGVGRALVAFGSDPLAEAAWSSERGFLDPVEAERLARRGERDTLAMHAIARRSRRAGELDGAEARFLSLVQAEPNNPVLLNDLGNLRYHQGLLAEATDLYQSATNELESAVIWFNLAQAHGKNIEVDQHEDALSVAQDLDRALVGKLAQRINGSAGGFVADLPLPSAQIHRRMLGGSGSAFADQTRRVWAPGWLGTSPGLGAILFLFVLIFAASWRKRTALSQWCSRCAAITDGLAGVSAANDALCEGCRQTRGQRHVGWQEADQPAPRSLLWVRLGFRLSGVVFPGVALTVSRPLAAWAGLTGAALVAAIGWNGAARVPDPLTMGVAAGWISISLGSVGAFFYLCSCWMQARARGL